MAKARSKKKAKSGSKSKSKKLAPKKKLAPRSAKKAVKAKKPAPKKAVAKKAVAKKPIVKKVVAKPAKKAVAKAPPKPKATPVAKARPAPKPRATPAPVQLVAPEVNRALAKADVEGLVSRLPPPLQPMVNTLRKLVLESAPEASERLDDGAPAYFANGVFARIEPSERSVLVRFLRGGQLPSASDLEGDTLSVTTVDEMKESVLRKLVREAVLLNLAPASPASPA